MGGVSGDLQVADRSCRVAVASIPAIAHLLCEPVVLGFPAREHKDLAVLKCICQVTKVLSIIVAHGSFFTLLREGCHHARELAILLLEVHPNMERLLRIDGVLGTRAKATVAKRIDAVGIRAVAIASRVMVILIRVAADVCAGLEGKLVGLHEVDLGAELPAKVTIV